MKLNSIVQKHGIIEQLPSSGQFDEQMAELEVNGYTIVESHFEYDYMEAMKETLERVYLDQVKEFGGEERLKQMNDKDIARGLLAYDDVFMDAICSESIQNFFKRVFDHGCILISQNGLLNRPLADFYQTAFHRDFNFQHWTCSKPLGITAILCLDDFTEENGATYVIPGSHNVTAFPTDQFVQKHEKQIVAPAGSFIVINSMMFHRAGINRSNVVRRGVAHVVGQPFCGQSINIPRFLELKGVLPPNDSVLQSFLGYRWGASDSVYDWRKSRLK